MSEAEIRHLRLKYWLWLNGLLFSMYILGVFSLVPVDGSIFIGVYCFASLLVLAIGLFILFKRKHLLHFLPSLQQLHRFIFAYWGDVGRIGSWFKAYCYL